MEFYKITDSIEVHKKNGTDVNYFIFPEFEIHLNRITPHTIQEWHYHSQIEEALLITKGALTCYWIENEQEKKYLAMEHEVVRVNKSVHTFANESDSVVEFTVFRFVPDGADKREIMKNDKTLWTEILLQQEQM